MAVSKSEEETKKIAKAMAKKVKNGGFIALFGDLGSGKTVFVKGLAEAFNVKNFSVKSPTYTYVRHYPISIYHIDLYRLEKIDDLLLQEILELMENKKNIIIVEWAEKMTDFLPEKRIDVKLKYSDENSREIEISTLPSLGFGAIYKKFHVPPHIIKHMEMVAEICEILADKLIKKGKKIDKEKLIEAALLHDVLKIHKTGKSGHEKAMEKVLKKMGKEDTAKIVGKHGFSSIYELKTWEEKILYYADKRVRDEKIVSLKKRFEEGDKRYGKRLDKRATAIKKKIFALEKELESILGKSVYKL